VRFNSFFLISLILLFAGQTQFSWGSEQVITAEIQREADSVVERQMREKVGLRAEKRASLLNVPAVDEQEVVGNGKTLAIYRRVQPPQLEPYVVDKSLTEVSSERQPSGTIVQPDPELLRGQRLVSPVITVYGGRYSIIEWPHEGKRYEIQVAVDLNCLREVTELESGEDTIDFFPIIVDVHAEAERAPKVVSESFGNGQKATFQFVQSRVPAKVRQEVAALESYWLQNRQELEEKWLLRQAHNKARKRWEAANPVPDKPTVINYFKIR